MPRLERLWRHPAKLSKNEVWKVPKYRDLNQLIDDGRKYFHLKIDGKDEEAAAEFWCKYGPYVKSLDMRFQSRCISAVLPNTHNVEELKLWKSETSGLAVTPFTLKIYANCQSAL